MCSNVTLDLGAIAIRFLLYPPRLHAGIVSVDAADAGDRVLRSFRLALEQRFPQLRIDDIGYRVDAFFRQYPSLHQWYQVVLDEQGIQIHFYQGAPWIPLDGFERWRDVNRWLDPDCLICLAFARQFKHPLRPGDLRHWDVYVTCDDALLSRNVERLPARPGSGIADIHTHLEGCECMPLLWLRLVNGELPRERFAFYRRAEAERRASNSDALREWGGEVQAIRHAIRARHALMRSQHIPGSAQELDGMGSSAETQWLPHEQLLPERRLLSALWVRLLQGRLTPPEVLQLDRYLYGKHLFLRRHIQSPGSNPGLENFRRFFDRARPLTPGRSERLKWRRFMSMVHFAGASPNLHSIELRISPLESVKEYVRFLTSWQEQEGRSPLLRPRKDDGRPLRVWFVIHLIRSRDDPSHPVAFGRLRTQLDRLTGVLQVFRWRHPSLARLIVGIDVANIERNSPIDVFTPYIRLLRGDGLGDDRAGETGLADSPHLSHWRRVAASGMHRPPWQLPRLGLTCHAGEDFFHPVTGLRTIWEIMRHGRMGPGDRIGHGLALGTDLYRFAALSGNTVIPAGEALDTLAWCSRRLRAIPGVDERALRVLDDEIDLLSWELYRERLTASELYELQRQRHRSPPSRLALRGVDHKVADLRRLELYDHECRQARQQLRTAPDALETIKEDTQRIQRWMLDEIARLGIFVEANPSSNLATGDFEHLRDHPLFWIREQNPGVRLTINCDDPGTFATRLENEYALVVDAARQRGLDPGEIEQFLESLVSAGDRALFHRAD